MEQIAIDETTHGKPDLEVAWGIQRLKISPLWKHGLTGESVRVGHLDTGVDGDHPALRGAVAEFVYFDDSGKEQTRNGGKPFDTAEHGTHTAGIIAGRPLDGTVIGVAPGAKLVSAVVIEDGDVRARIVAGIRWAMTQGIRVLNISIGLHGWCKSFLPIMREVCKQGILPVAAVGDEGRGAAISPGNYGDVLSIGACDECDAVPVFSSSQRFFFRRNVPTIIAPGDRIRSAAPDTDLQFPEAVPDLYQVMSGTSMAAAHISGLAALLCQAAPSATAKDIKGAIFGSCKRPSGVPRVRGSRGIPDAVVALKILTGIDIAGV
ncbi:MAG TPA: S8 family serine peptidase [Candidatus Angelobacter sp.]|nr:S8 family serine peptidase [Candidatus Angelobacter sp.]